MRVIMCVCGCTEEVRGNCGVTGMSVCTCKSMFTCMCVCGVGGGGGGGGGGRCGCVCAFVQDNVTHIMGSITLLYHPRIAFHYQL